MSAASEEVRREFGAVDDKRDAGLTTPEEVCRRDNIPYGPDPRWQALDVYRPRGAGDAPLPVIVSVHGGAWVYGDKERYQYYCMELARRGFAVVNFSYRLAPESKFPAPLEDTNTVFHWVLAHGKDYGLDTERIFAVGDSAGAHILGLYCNFCTNPAYAARFSFAPPAGFAPRAVVLNCGKYEMGPGSDARTRALMADFLPRGGTAEELEEINVLRYVTPDFPPTFLMTCVEDQLRDQTPLLAARLMEQEVPFLFRFYGDRENRLLHVFQLTIRLEDARRCNDEECDWLRRFL
ncbi:MAG: alpha/beta hydrolase [Oscillospiraceae bacterium]|nr:alpha/beta hydrolase [Oscillospiraceae bacterium]